MPSAPITSPSPGQLVRSARSFVSEVIVAPQATPVACDVAGTANSRPIAGAMTYLKAVIQPAIPPFRDLDHAVAADRLEQRAVVRGDHERPAVGAQRRLDHLERVEVEVVGGLVEQRSGPRPRRPSPRRARAPARPGESRPSGRSIASAPEPVVGEQRARLVLGQRASARGTSRAGRARRAAAPGVCGSSRTVPRTSTSPDAGSSTPPARAGACSCPPRWARPARRGRRRAASASAPANTPSTATSRSAATSRRPLSSVSSETLNAAGSRGARSHVLGRHLALQAVLARPSTSSPPWPRGA